MKIPFKVGDNVIDLSRVEAYCFRKHAYDDRFILTVVMHSGEKLEWVSGANPDVYERMLSFVQAMKATHEKLLVNGEWPS